MTARFPSPIEHLTGPKHERADADANPAFQLVELEDTGQVSVRVDPSIALRLELPSEPNTFVASGDRRSLWLGPDEWLVVAPVLELPTILLEFDRAIRHEPHSIVNVSANRILLRLRGERVREVLSTCCTLDLHPSAWTPGRCAQTLVADVPVVLAQDDATSTHLLVRPSFAEHLVRRLWDVAELTR